MTSKHSPPVAIKRQGGQEALRKFGIAARAAMTEAQREIASAKIAESVIRSSCFRSAKSVACYLSLPAEVDTWLLVARAWRMKKRVFVPVVKKNSVMKFRELSPDSELFRTPYGLLEPRDGQIAAPRELDLVLTPVVAFDQENNRIGMGGGYFDRTFAFLRHRKHLYHPKLLGLAFTCQRVDKITPNPWDIRLFRVIDENS